MTPTDDFHENTDDAVLDDDAVETGHEGVAAQRVQHLHFALVKLVSRHLHKTQIPLQTRNST